MLAWGPFGAKFGVQKNTYFYYGFDFSWGFRGFPVTQMNCMVPRTHLGVRLCPKPWVFNYLVGLDNSSKYFSFLKLGNILIVGTPADFSGELVKPLEEFALSKQMNLIINSFNGGYLGYITNDNWYNKKNIKAIINK